MPRTAGTVQQIGAAPHLNFGARESSDPVALGKNIDVEGWSMWKGKRIVEVPAFNLKILSHAKVRRKC
jgi:hypothetical protein